MILRRASLRLKHNISLKRSICIGHDSRSFATAHSPDLYDVVCVGGGPAGLSLLAALKASRSTRHLRLALVESQDLDFTRNWKLPHDQFSNRASSLTPASTSYLSQIGAWDHVEPNRVQEFNHMRVWDGMSTNGRVSFDSPSAGHAIAYMTENQNLTRALLLRIQELEGVDIFDKTSVAHINYGTATAEVEAQNEHLDLSSHPHIELSSKRTLVARLLIGADGLNSPVRTFADIHTRGWDYDRHGVVATLKLSSASYDSSAGGDRTAYQRFLPSGPIAMLPLPNQHASLVWTTTPARAAHLKNLQSDDFLAMVNAAFRLSTVDIDYMSSIPSGQVDELEWRASINKSQISDMEIDDAIPAPAAQVQNGSVASFPLRFRHASTYIRPRIALIGDAAHTIHPLAGQGLNMGLADSRSLATNISSAMEYGADIGDEMQCLNAYNADMWMPNSRMLGTVDKLHWLYSMNSAPIVALRGLGLGAVDWAGSVGLKDWFMKQAGGV